MDSAATFTGIVSDSFCGNHHYNVERGDDTACTGCGIAHQGLMQGLQDEGLPLARQ
jgi:hypothetical protein